MDLGKITLYLSKKNKVLDEVVDTGKMSNEGTNFVVRVSVVE